MSYVCERCDQPAGRDGKLTRIFHFELLYLALDSPSLLCSFLIFNSCVFCVEKMTTTTPTQIRNRHWGQQQCTSSPFPVTQILMRSWCYAATEDTLASVALQATLKLLDQFHQLPQLQLEPMCLLPHWRRICLNVLVLDRKELDTVFYLFSATLLPTSHLLFRPLPCLPSSCSEEHWYVPNVHPLTCRY
jgi:hypothetical protein